MELKEFLKKAFKGCFHLFGMEVSAYSIYKSEDLLMKTILEVHGIKTIIDVGANQGQYAGKMWGLGFSGEIFSFEPISKPFSVLSRRAARNSSWHAHHLGIGSTKTEMEINVSENIVSSSMLKVSDNSLKAEPATKIVGKEKIRLDTLDSFFENHPLNNEIMLKLDVQGFELEALRGGERSLSKFKLLQIELSLVPLYDGGPLFDDIVKFLAARGFEIFTIVPGFRDPNSGRMLQADGIFIRSKGT